MIWYVLIPILGAILIGIYLAFKVKKPQNIFIRATELDYLEIQVPKADEDRLDYQAAALAAENMFATLHGLLKEDIGSQEQMSFEFVSVDRGIRFYVVCPPNITKYVESQIYAQYPNSHITKVSDYVPETMPSGTFEVANLSFKLPEYYPIKTFRDFESDSLSSITSALSEADDNEDLWFQIVVRPVADIWQSPGHSKVDEIRSGTSKPPSLASEIPTLLLKEFGKIVGTFMNNLVGGKPEEVSNYVAKSDSRKSLSPVEDLVVKGIENKLAKMGFQVNIRFLSYAEDEERANRLMRSLIASMKQFSTVSLNSFNYKIVKGNLSDFDDYRQRTLNVGESIVLNIEELASIYHLPSASVKTPGVSRVDAKKSEPPTNLPTSNCNFIGETLFRDKKVKFGISNEGEDRVRHMYLIGKTGTGKSTLFKNMIVQDILNGYGVGVVDPHGDLVEDVLDYIPEHRVKDVVIVDPSDSARPVGINILEIDDPEQKNLMASGLVSGMKQHFWSWGPRLEYLLNYCVLTLLEVPGTTLLGITRLLTDQNYQKFILQQINDPVVLDFWNEEFKAMKGNQRLITEAVAPIQNKINRFLSSTTIRNILGQRNSTVDIWDIMNNKKILLLNLSKGKIGDDNANLLGALLVSRIQFMTMQRVRLAPEKRLPFYLYVDEFQNFAGGNFESILSESRKYRLGLHLTHQFTSQLPEELLSAVFGNVGTMAAFAIGAQDAKTLQTEFAPYFDENDLISLRKFQVYMKLMIDGQTSRPFSAMVPRPWLPEETLIHKTNFKQQAIDYSRQTYGVDRTGVEEKIRKWVEFDFDKGKAIAMQHRATPVQNGNISNPTSENVG